MGRLSSRGLSGAVRAEFGEDDGVIINHGILELELSHYLDPWAGVSR